ncbi:hypothetical protein D3C71_1620860 [compost metagenome]
MYPRCPDALRNEPAVNVSPKAAGVREGGRTSPGIGRAVSAALAESGISQASTSMTSASSLRGLALIGPLPKAVWIAAVAAAKSPDRVSWVARLMSCRNSGCMVWPFCGCGISGCADSGRL